MWLPADSGYVLLPFQVLCTSCEDLIPGNNVDFIGNNGNMNALKINKYRCRIVWAGYHLASLSTTYR
jgi:hypothetical protein